MTIKELIERLKSLPEDTKVYVRSVEDNEYGEATSVLIDAAGDVLITE